MGGGASSSRIAANHQQARKEGDSVPDVTIKVRVRVADGEEVSAFAWKDFPISELFKGKRVVVFSIPGGKCSMTILEMHCLQAHLIMLLFLFSQQLSHLYVHVITCPVTSSTTVSPTPRQRIYYHV